ncbi:MAG: hypothetical protein HZB25_05185 [Candidatus Eisenbacteria bacterium]|nr:hypothetical protein [Candidatus Eisenbacteria bacterium]
MTAAGGPGVHGIRTALLAGAAVALLAGCSTRERSNPLDPLNPDTGGRLQDVTATAAHSRVSLSWSVFAFSPTPQLLLERAETNDPVFATLASVPLTRAGFVDTTARDGVQYVYRLRAVTASGPGLPTEVTATPGPEVVWLADAGRDRLAVLAPDCGAVRASLEVFNFPSDVAWDAVTGELWLANTFDGVVAELDSAGNVRATHTALDYPRALAVDPRRGGCWVADDHAGTVALLAPGGQLLARATGFAGPVGLAVDPSDGGAWVAEADAGRITRVRRDGTRVVSRRGFAQPEGLAFDPGGPHDPPSLWVADFGADQLVRLDADGVERYRLVGFPGVLDVIVDPADGSVWVACSKSGAGSVSRLSREGRVLWTVEGPVNPVALAVNPADQSVWVADAADNAAWKIAASGSPARRLGDLGYPLGIAVVPGPVALPFAPGAVARAAPRVKN